ncbi:MAG TPA: ABC transporter ATP-binding protein [Spirochaetia bacterium]|nr:ABC transporter ATP-binding protein [Spirochaetia bacterium]
MSLPKALRFARPHRWWAAASVVSAILVVGTALVPPALSKRLVDGVFVASVNDGNFASRRGLLLVLIGALVAVNALRACMIFLRNTSVEVYSQRVTRDLKQHLYDHIQSQSFDFFHNTRTGELMARMTNDVEMIRSLLTQGLLNGVGGAFFIVGSAIVLSVLNWQLTLVAVVAAPLLFWVAIRLRLDMREPTQAVRQQFSTLNTTVQENISGIRVVKAFMRHAHEHGKFRRDNESLTTKRNTNMGVWARYMPHLEFLSNIASAMVLFAGGWLVIRGRITLGTWVQFNGYLWMLVQPMRGLGDVANQVAMASASAERIWDILELQPNIASPRTPRRPARIAGDVELRGVCFSAGDRPILKNINLHAPPGSTIAIMGPTGSGKSSLVHLITRFYDPTAGQVLIDGIDARELDLAFLRENVGFVAQETFLFSETLYNNLTYGKEGASLELVEKVASQTQVDEFIRPLADGYDTIVGERGVGLSGGQKQRASLARALMKQAPILILDDSTSSVDMETEARIQAALRNLDHRATTFIIAHRISSIIHADQIIVLDHGEIVEQGHHEGLLERRGLYAEYYDVQQTQRARGDGGR